MSHLSQRATFFLTALCLVLVLGYGHRPLWHSDLWDHVNYGRRILETQSLGATEPLLPLAQHTPLVSTAWGSQIAMAAVVDAAGAGLPAMQFFHGLLVVLALAAVGRTVWTQTGSVVFGILAGAVCLAVNWQQWLIVRPQLWGVTFFCAVLMCLHPPHVRRKSVWWLLPALFAAWANLHGSWPMGLALMAAIIGGRAVDLALRTGKSAAIARSASIRRQIWLWLACATAVVLNPYGAELYTATLKVGRHPNISSMYEWAPLTLHMKQGKTAAAAIVAAALALCWTTRRWRAAELLPLLATATLCIWSSRMINWFAPVVAWVLTVHLAAVYRRFRTGRRLKSSRVETRRLPTQTGWQWTVVGVSVCVISFCATSWGQQVVTGRCWRTDQLLAERTPIQVGRFLSDAAWLDQQLMFVPAEWSGYLFYATDDRLRPMVNIHVHLIPPEVWSDYLRLIRGDSEWRACLQRYGIQTLVTDRRQHGPLIDRLQHSSEFQQVCQDGQSIIFRAVSAPTGRK